jgi:DNA polymerase V
MNSVYPPDAICLSPGAAVLLPWVEGSVPAGFPSPAADFAQKRHDFNDLLVIHVAATFMWRARGESMIELGITDGDVLVCDRALKPERGDIVIAEVDSDFTVKQYWLHNGVPQLRSGNSTFPPIFFKDGQTMTICGVVTWTLRNLRRDHVRNRRR